MNDKKRRGDKSCRRGCERAKGSILGLSVVVGVVILIMLLLFWVDIADILGWGDGSA